MLEVLRLGWSFWRVITRAFVYIAMGMLRSKRCECWAWRSKTKLSPLLLCYRYTNFPYLLIIDKFALSIIQIHCIIDIQCSSFFCIPLLCWCEWRSVWTCDLCLFLVMNTTTHSLLELIHGRAGHSPWRCRRWCHGLRFSPSQVELVPATASGSTTSNGIGAFLFVLGAVGSVHFTGLGRCTCLSKILLMRCELSGWTDFLDVLATKSESGACVVICVARILLSSTFSYESYLRYHMKGRLCLVPVLSCAELY